MNDRGCKGDTRQDTVTRGSGSPESVIVTGEPRAPIPAPPCILTYILTPRLEIWVLLISCSFPCEHGFEAKTSHLYQVQKCERKCCGPAGWPVSMCWESGQVGRAETFTLGGAQSTSGSQAALFCPSFLVLACLSSRWARGHLPWWTLKTVGSVRMMLLLEI